MKRLTSGRTMQASDSGERVDVRASAVGLLQEAHRLKDLAEQNGDYRTAILAIDRCARAIEIIDKWQEAHPPEEADISRHPEFLRLMQRIIQALDPHPEARAAVQRALKTSDESIRSSAYAHTSTIESSEE